jgi:hypothetical protein
LYDEGSLLKHKHSKSHDHENLRVLENHPKAEPWGKIIIFAIDGSSSSVHNIFSV